MSSSLTHAYFAELKGIAKLSGADFGKVLLDKLVMSLPKVIMQPNQMYPKLARNLSQLATQPKLSQQPTKTKHL